MQPLFNELKGQFLELKDGTTVKVQEIVHSYAYPNCALINEEHFIDYLDLFAQINGEELTQEDRDLWQEMIKDQKRRKL